MIMTKVRQYVLSKITFEQLDNDAVEKDRDWDNECCWWIFEDGSAIGIDSFNEIYFNDAYGRHPDHEKL
jgi:hypothetical protein